MCRRCRRPARTLSGGCHEVEKLWALSNATMTDDFITIPAGFRRVRFLLFSFIVMMMMMASACHRSCTPDLKENEEAILNNKRERLSRITIKGRR